MVFLLSILKNECSMSDLVIINTFTDFLVILFHNTENKQISKHYKAAYNNISFLALMFYPLTSRK